jgi:hypothetical protein
MENAMASDKKLQKIKRIPFEVKNAIGSLAKGNIHKVKNKPISEYSDGLCHRNVKKHVEQCGGEQLYGWVLSNLKAYIENGLYIWAFHSVWRETKERMPINVNNVAGLEKSKFIIFWEDRLRSYNFEEDMSYNNIFVLSNEKKKWAFEQQFKMEIEVGVAYWHSENLAKDIGSSSGQYRALINPNNKEKLINEFGTNLAIMSDNDRAEAGFKYSLDGEIDYDAK